MRRPIVPRIWETPHHEGLPQITVGRVTSTSVGGHIDIRVGTSSARTVRATVLADGLNLQTDDRVVAAHIGDSPRWVVLCRVLDTSEIGLNIGSTLGRDELHPPNNFSVSGISGMVLATWDAWPGNTVCWEVQHNSSSSVVNASTFYTRGSYFLYPSTTAATRHVRVRAVRYDVETNSAYYSRYTAWAAATSLAVSVSASSHRFSIDGPLATATGVGGKYCFYDAGSIKAIGMCLKGIGSVGITRVDVNLDGVSLWLLGGVQPYLAASDTSVFCMHVSDLDVSEVAHGDVLTVDVDEVATGATDLDVIIHMV